MLHVYDSDIFFDLCPYLPITDLWNVLSGNCVY